MGSRRKEDARTHRCSGAHSAFCLLAASAHTIEHIKTQIVDASGEMRGALSNGQFMFQMRFAFY
jgi:hypothetical protein